MTPSVPAAGKGKVWRYLSFSRFVWMLQKKQLWLARADLLGDPWEIALTGDQLAFVIARHPIQPIDDPRPRETAQQRIARIIPLWRRSTFANCWSKSEHESHALWRIYCDSVEGIAVQTTFPKLKLSVGSLTVYPVTYGKLGTEKRTPQVLDLVTRKQPWYRYEQEVRVLVRHDADSKAGTLADPLGHGLHWDPERILESIRVHPDADDSFMERVRAAVEQYAPGLKRHIEWSEMRTRPEF